MSTSDTAQNVGTLPLERKKDPAPKAVINPNEQTEEIDIIGYPDESPVKRIFDANSGGELIFNLPKLDASTIKIDSDTTVPTILQSEIFTAGLYKTLEVTKTGIDAFGGVLGAVVDLAKNDVAFKAPAEQQPESDMPQDKTAKNTAIETQYVNQKQGDTEAKSLSIRRDLENQARTTPLRQEISARTGLPEWLSDIVNEKGEARTDLVASVEQSRREALKRQQAGTGTISSPAKHGAEGPSMTKEDNKSGERQGFTAQTAIG